MSNRQEIISSELAQAVPNSGWNRWTDLSNGEPYTVWLTPPGEQIRYNRYILPLDFIIKLDELNPVEQQLAHDERVVVAQNFMTKWFLGCLAGQLVETYQDPDSSIYTTPKKGQVCSVTESVMSYAYVNRMTHCLIETTKPTTSMAVHYLAQTMNTFKKRLLISHDELLKK